MSEPNVYVAKIELRAIAGAEIRECVIEAIRYAIANKTNVSLIHNVTEATVSYKALMDTVGYIKSSDGKMR